MGTYAGGDRVTFDIRMRLPLVTGTYAAYAGVRRMRDNVELATAGPLTFFLSGRSMAVGVADLQASFTRQRPVNSAPSATVGQQYQQYQQ